MEFITRLDCRYHCEKSADSFRFWTEKFLSRLDIPSFSSNWNWIYLSFFSALINDFSSPVPPDIFSFTPFIYNITVRGEQVELLVPANQGNWIDCSDINAENSTMKEQLIFGKSSFLILDYVSLCAKSLVLSYPIPFLEFCPKTTPTELTVEVCVHRPLSKN